MTNKNERYDLCVIGAGSAGLSMAAGAAQLGLNTVLIEKSEMGGDCLNTGCVPSKALLQAAKVAQTFRKSQVFGIESQDPEIDFSAVKNHVNHVISTIEPHDSQERFESLGVKVIRETAEFLDKNTVQAGDQTIKARYFLIATGSRAMLPSIEGLDLQKVYTNENIFALRDKPSHLIIVGGGPIGVEMAQAHRRLGSKVSIIDRGSILTKDDPELVDILRARLVGEGVDLYEETSIKSVTHESDNEIKVIVGHQGRGDRNKRLTYFGRGGTPTQC